MEERKIDVILELYDCMIKNIDDYDDESILYCFEDEEKFFKILKELKKVELNDIYNFLKMAYREYQEKLKDIKEIEKRYSVYNLNFKNDLNRILLSDFNERYTTELRDKLYEIIDTLKARELLELKNYFEIYTEFLYDLKYDNNISDESIKKFEDNFKFIENEIKKILIRGKE